MSKPENKMLLAVLDVSKVTDDATYFKTRGLGLNSIGATLKNGKLYIELVKFPKEEKAGNIVIDPLSNQEDVPF